MQQDFVGNAHTIDVRHLVLKNYDATPLRACKRQTSGLKLSRKNVMN